MEDISGQLLAPPLPGIAPPVPVIGVHGWMNSSPNCTLPYFIEVGTWQNSYDTIRYDAIEEFNVDSKAQ